MIPHQGRPLGLKENSADVISKPITSPDLDPLSEDSRNILE